MYVVEETVDANDTDIVASVPELAEWHKKRAEGSKITMPTLVNAQDIRSQSLDNVAHMCRWLPAAP